MSASCILLPPHIHDFRARSRWVPGLALARPEAAVVRGWSCFHLKSFNPLDPIGSNWLISMTMGNPANQHEPTTCDSLRPLAPPGAWSSAGRPGYHHVPPCATNHHQRSLGIAMAPSNLSCNGPDRQLQRSTQTRPCERSKTP